MIGGAHGIEREQSCHDDCTERTPFEAIVVVAKVNKQADRTDKNENSCPREIGSRTFQRRLNGAKTDAPGGVAPIANHERRIGNRLADRAHFVPHGDRNIVVADEPERPAFHLQEHHKFARRIHERMGLGPVLRVRCDWVVGGRAFGDVHVRRPMRSEDAVDGALDALVVRQSHHSIRQLASPECPRCAGYRTKRMRPARTTGGGKGTG